MNRIALAIIASCLPAWVMAQGVPGTFYMQHYQVRDLNNDTRVASMWQDSLGIMCLATRAGVFEYDGSNWRFLQLPNHTSIVKPAPSGKWFAGARQGGFLLHPRPDGSMWSQRLDARQRIVKNVRDIAFVGDAVCFYSSNAIYLYDAANMQLFAVLVEPNNGFRGFFYHMNSLYVLVKDKGLAIMRGNRLKPLHTRAIEGEVRGSVPVSRTSSVFFTSRGEAYVINHDSLSLAQSQPLAGVIPTGEVVSVISLNDSLFSVATSRAGVFIMRKATLEVTSHLCIATGLLDDGVLAQTVDLDGGLWVSTKVGITRVDMALPVRDAGAAPGLAGNVMAFQFYHDNFFVATSQGVFVGQVQDGSSLQGRLARQCKLVTIIATLPEKNARNGALSAVRVAEKMIIDTAYAYSSDNSSAIASFVKLDALPGVTRELVATHLGLFAVTDQGVFRIDGDEVQPVILGDSCLDVAATVSHLVVLKHGCLVLFDMSGTPNPIDTLAMEGIVNMTDVCFAAGFVWVSAGNMVMKIPELPAKIFGFPKDIFSVYPEAVNVFGDEKSVFFGSGNKLLVYDKLSDSLKLSRRLDNFIRGNNKNIALAISAGDVNVLGNMLFPAGVMRLARMFDADMVGGSGDGELALLDGNQLYVIFDSCRTLPAVRPFISTATTMTGRILGTDKIFIENKTDGLVLALACPYFVAEAKTEFRFKLDGLADEWSPWSPVPELTFRYLPAGRYTVEIEARNAAGTVLKMRNTSINVKSSLEDYARQVIFVAATIVVVVLATFLVYRGKRRRWIKSGDQGR